MKTQKIWAKLTAVFLAVQLICGMIPATVYASNAESEQTLIVQESQKMPAFEEVVSVDNIQIAVKAPEGAFPEGAHLCVDRLAEGLQEQSDKAVEGIRPAGLNVVCSYTYDIYVSAEDGTRLVPENGQPAEVTFILPEAADADLRADVYTVVTDENSGELTASAAESLIDRAESAVRVSADRLEVFSLEFSDSDRTEEPTGAEEMPVFDQSFTS